jgi:signal transduction histidine kinase
MRGQVRAPFHARRAAHRLIRMRRLQLAILLVIFALGILVAVQSYRSIDQELTASATSRRTSLSYLAAVTVTEKLDRVVDLGVSLATRVRFRDLVAQGNWPEAVKIMANVSKDFPAIDRIFLSDLTGRLMADVPEVPALHGRDFSFRDWYKGVSAGWKPYVSQVYKRAAAPQINVIAAAIPIRSQAGDTVGILVLQVKLESFFAWLKEIDFGPEGQLYVVDRAGTLAFYPGQPPEGDPLSLAKFPLVQKMLAGDRGVEVAKDPLNGADNLVAYEPLPRYGWAVAAEQPVETAFATRDAQLRRILIAYGLIAIFSLVAVYLGVRIVGQRRRAAADAEAKAELERRVAERTAELQRSNQELESFSYSVSHDLRTPLRAIDGFAAILDEDHRDTLGPVGRQHLTTIRKNTQRMGQLIDDLLAFARLGRSPIAAGTVDMEALAREVVHDLRGHLDGADTAQIDVHPLPAAQGDLALLRQVWVNLISNALKFSAGREPPRIEVGGNEVAGECVYYVRDNGVGFDMTYGAKLFGVFQRLHGADEFPGSGVGLAIVKRIVTRHGGSVSAESTIGGGATFRFTLPGRKSEVGSLKSEAAVPASAL